MSGPTTKQPPRQPVDNGVAAAAIADGKPVHGANGFELAEALNAAGETAYVWDIVGDRLHWAENAPQVLGVASLDSISTEAGYRSLIAPDHVDRRALVGSSGHHVQAGGVPYKAQYRLASAGRETDAALWVEDQGRCWAGPDGRPARAAGVIRAIASGSSPAVGAPEALKSAWQALSWARRRPGDAYSGFPTGVWLDRVGPHDLGMAKAVISALEGGRMRLALQPIVSTATWQPVLQECLLRMELADGTTLAAGQFIRVTERLGLSRFIDRRALELAVELLMEQPGLHLALNVSGLTCGDSSWLEELHRLTAGTRLTERLTIEITETAAIEDFDQSVAFVDTLKELGCRVAVDDFGAGYTSFKNLKHLAVDMVKIDGAFVRNLAQDKSDQVFIKVMAELARSLGMETVAEWVGDAATARLLADAGIDYLQGFHFGEPVLWPIGSFGQLASGE